MNALTLVARRKNEVRAITLHGSCTITLILMPSGATAFGGTWHTAEEAAWQYQQMAVELDLHGWEPQGPVMERELGEAASRSIKRLGKQGNPRPVQYNTRRLLLGIGHEYV